MSIYGYLCTKVGYVIRAWVNASKGLPRNQRFFAVISKMELIFVESLAYLKDKFAKTINLKSDFFS